MPRSSLFRTLSSTLLIPTTLSIAACGGGGDAESERDGLLAIDREFAQASVQFGAAQAFYMYMSDDAVMLRNNSPRLVGPESIRDAMEAERGMTLDWIPLDGAVSASGDLGYTWGTWESTVSNVETGGADISTGRYVTVWRRDADGSWRVALDIGNNGARPESEDDGGEAGQ